LVSALIWINAFRWRLWQVTVAGCAEVAAGGTTMQYTFVGPLALSGLAVSGLLLLGAPVQADDLMDSARELFAPIPTEPPALEGNPATPEKVALGTMLYFEPRLSESHTINCNSCHALGLGGVDMMETSVGHRWQRGGRNAPTVLNSVFNTAQFWDGRAADLEEQAGGPLVNPIEMASPREHVAEQLKGIPGYHPLFAKAFPGETEPITFENAEKAIAVFEATLITSNAPFDRYLRGDEAAMSEEQKEGLQMFIDNGCAGCHSGINVGGDQYQPFGVVELPGSTFLPPEDKGRFEVTKSVDDEYVFKVPTLRNIALTPPYFHTGRSWDLRQAVAVMGSAQLGITLTDDEIDKITAFLHALTGDQPQVVYPILPPSVVTTPRPQP
jgi:cytochrome c peroxidase